MFKKKYACVRQHDASDCAAACIATILETYKSEQSIIKLREILGTDMYGTTVKGVVEGLEKLNFKVKAVKTSIEHMTSEMTYPLIAQIKTKEGLNHFVVVHHLNKKDIFTIADPGSGIIEESRESFSDKFLGVLIIMVPSSEFEQIRFKNKSLFELFKSLILPHKKVLITVILASFLLTLFGIFSSLFSKVLMDEIIPNQLKNSLFIFLILFGFINTIQVLLSAFRQQVLLYLSRKIDLPLLMGYYDHILHLPYQFFVTRKTGDILTRFQDAMTIKQIFTSVSLSLVMDICLAILTGIALIIMNARLFIILVVMLVINILLVYFFRKPYKKLNIEQMEAAAMLNSQLIDSIKNIETVKSQGDEVQQLDYLEDRYVQALKIGYKEGVLKNIQGSISSLTGTIGTLLFMGIGGLAIIDGQMTIGDLLVFQSLSQYFTEPVQNLVSLQLTFQEAQIAMKRLSELMTLDREDETLETSISNININGDIYMNNLTFAYGSRAPILKQFSLDIKQGMKVAIVGESGAGKSTLAKLLLKFMEPQSGKIEINGYDLQDINYQELRKQIAYIPQNIELFTGSILHNLKVGNENASYEEVVMACKKSGAHAFIDRLPNRYQSFVEEDGSNFSGGEKQRIAIARALLSNPNLYIFDEATSNLDSFSEQHIQRLIFASKDKTVLIIAHRLSTIVQCDLICFMKDGQIIEKGTHDELINLNGYYAKMIALQSNQVVNRELDKEVGEMSYE